MNEFTVSAEEMLSLLKIIETIMIKLDITQEDVNIFSNGNDYDMTNFYGIMNEVKSCIRDKEEK